MSNFKIKAFLQNKWFYFGLFVVLYLLLAFFHEPMYDEAQAWMIARDASWYELIFEIPHYEGHPPLWHLILAIFAKTGMSIDIGLRIPGAIFSIVTAGLIIFKAPFPKVVRYALPFTYYMFFRYSVVVRPYCITMLAFCLAAMAYRKRAEKPFAFAAALLLLCMSNAYGIMFAAGICIVWIIELFTTLKEHRGRQIAAMSILLVYNIGQLLLMIPEGDTNSVAIFSVATILYGLVYMLVLGPADAMFLDTGMDARLQHYAEGIVSGSAMSYVNLFFGAVTVLVLLHFARKYRKLLLFSVPYILFSIFSATVYFWYHHIGLIYLWIVFSFWCALSEKDKITLRNTPEYILKILGKSEKLCKLMPRFALALCLGMSLSWSVFCTWTDLTKITWYTKDLAEGIRLVGADQDNCALQWEMNGVGPFESFEDYTDASKYNHIPSVTVFFDCLAYFDKNIFYNHNEGNPDISYNRQILAEPEIQNEMLEDLAEYGYPEFVVGQYFQLDALPIEEDMPGYAPVYRFEVYKPDKFIIDYSDRYIYAREDIYQQRDVWPIEEQLRLSR